MSGEAGARPGRLRSVGSFGVSASVHGFLLGWLVLATPGDPDPPRKSVYDQEIRPHEDRLVWYNLRDKLPDISPSAAKKDRRPPRARNQFDQVLVAGRKDDPSQRQMIWMPEPKAPAPEAPPLPNVLAIAAAPPARPFTAPEMPKQIFAPAPLPEEPKTPLDLDIPEYKAALPLPPRKEFTPPKAKKQARRAEPLPDAPRAMDLSVDVPDYRPALPLPPHKEFTAPPLSKAGTRPAVVIPEAPRSGAVVTGVPEYHSALPLPPHKEFTPPPAARRAATSPADPALPEAPTAGGPRASEGGGYRATVLTPPTREFTPPPQPKSRATGSGAALPDAPAASGMPQAESSPAMAIAGLDPARLTDLPKPPGSQEANFSAGPELRAKGASETGGGGVVVPGLLSRGGTPAPTVATLQRPKWMDPLHPLDGVMPSPEARATRVSDAPDPVLQGRVVYTMAIQMPNVTSFSGSWMVWFAERAAGGEGSQVLPPNPLRKVDPKYVASAVADRIEGKVRLAAIIRKDGSVDRVELLHHLDPRLDQTAEEALAKWIFQPARRNGIPIDVDAVFEIPFFLAPKPAK